MAKKLRDYENRQHELIALINDMKNKGLKTIALTDKHVGNVISDMTEIDPFTFFANFNMPTKDENRKGIIRFLKERWHLNADVPNDFNGIPTITPIKAWFVAYKKDRKPEDIPLLWTIFKQALDNEVEEGTFNAALKIIDMPVLAGRIIKTKLPCCYEEHTLDIPDNQIIAWTIHVILHSGICGGKTIKVLREVERRLGGTVSLLLFSGADCIGRLYSRLNADYELLHKLCRFFLDNSGPTHQIGRRSMIPFLVNMARLFELFVARWINAHLDPQYRLKTQESLVVSKDGNLKMQMDLVLYGNGSEQPLCVLDTKYKVHGSIQSPDYNQAVAYADALHCDTALLLYPQELAMPFDVKKGNVRVKTIAFDVSKDLDESGKFLLEQIYECLPC